MAILRRLRRRSRARPGRAVLVVLAALVTVFLAMRVAHGIAGWQAGGPRPLEPWMTVGIVARMHDLNPRALDAAAGLPLPDPRPWTLGEIAAAEGVPVEDIYARVEAAVAELAGDGR